MTAEQVVRRSLETWNADDRAGHRSTYADDAVLKEYATGREIVGGDQIVEVHFAWRAAFPGVRGEIANLIASGDQVAYETAWMGTHTGPLATPDGQMLPGTGKSIDLPACLVMTVRDEKIVEQHHYFDLVTMMTQLEVMPATA